ncbi:MAG: DNA polymerase III subunit delta [Actinomycetota bacterium]
MTTTDGSEGSSSVTLPAYLIVGDDAHLSGEARRKLLKGLPDSAIDEFSAADEFDQIAQALVTPPMFEERRTVVVTDFEKLPAESQRKLIAYLDDPAPQSTLVLVGAKASSQMTTAVKASGHVIQVGKGRRNDLLLWLKREFAEQGLSAGGDAMNALVDAVGEQRLALSRAVEELSLVKGAGRVTADDVRRQFQGRADVKLFGFIDSVAARQGEAALQSLRLLLAQGEPAQLVFWNLTRHFRMLLMATEGGPNHVAKALSIPQWRAEKLVRQVRNFSRDELLDAYEILADADLKMKSSAEPEGLTLERAVLDITGR